MTNTVDVDIGLNTRTVQEETPTQQPKLFPQATTTHRPQIQATNQQRTPEAMLTSPPMDGDDPIDQPDYNVHTYREPNPETIAHIRALARSWRAAVEEANDARAELDAAIIAAKEAGHSFAQIREATGLGTGTIQMLLAKAGLAPDPRAYRKKNTD